MADFQKALASVFEYEGGLINLPNDKGGLTRFGISQAQFPDLDIANLTLADAEKIYRSDYWYFDGIQDQELANRLMNLSVWRSPVKAIKMLQQALCACGRVVAIDGVLGNMTLYAANSLPANELIAALKQESREYIEKRVKDDPSQEEFQHGWLRRFA